MMPNCLKNGVIKFDKVYFQSEEKNTFFFGLKWISSLYKMRYNAFVND
jgi:hypothetical protein